MQCEALSYPNPSNILPRLLLQPAMSDPLVNLKTDLCFLSMATIPRVLCTLERTLTLIGALSRTKNYKKSQAILAIPLRSSTRMLRALMLTSVLTKAAQAVRGWPMV